MRNMLFISHANPEDNNFSRWLALQLGKEGYPVWCDLTRLLGGEDFWTDIEQAIRERTCKFIYVLSKSSNHKPGPLQELQLAASIARKEELHDFIIPVLIDDLSHGDTNIQLARINTIDFHQGWVSGLRTLLKKLEEDKVTKDTRFAPNSVASWWQSQVEAQCTLAERPEDYLSNWFPILHIPKVLYLHSNVGQLIWWEKANKLSYPAYPFGSSLVSFAKASDLFEGHQTTLGGLEILEFERFIGGLKGPIYLKPRQATNIVYALLRMAWEKFIAKSKMSSYMVARRPVLAYFKDGMIPNNNLRFSQADGTILDRNVVGINAMKNSMGTIVGQRYWHFAIEAKPLLYPQFTYIIKPHVLFSSDGKTIWESTLGMHRARRSACRNWWNPEWRDRTLATIKWLAGNNDVIKLDLGPEAWLEIASSPVAFTSPVSYLDPDTSQGLEEDVEDIMDEEEDEDESKS